MKASCGGMHLPLQSGGGRDRRTTGACWPASPSELVKPRVQFETLPWLALDVDMTQSRISCERVSMRTVSGGLSIGGYLDGFDQSGETQSERCQSGLGPPQTA